MERTLERQTRFIPPACPLIYIPAGKFFAAGMLLPIPNYPNK
jgi:hypothetical protein